MSNTVERQTDRQDKLRTSTRKTNIIEARQT